MILSEQDYKLHYAGMPSDTNAITLVSQFRLDIRPADLYEQKTKATNDYLAHNSFPLMPGVIQTLDHLYSQNYIPGVVTGASREGIDATIRQHQLQAYFSTIVSKDDVINSKPAPDCYLLALRNIDMNANQSIAIEDTEHGLQSATAAGIPTLAIPNDMTGQHDFSSAHGVFANMHQTREWIDKQRDMALDD